MSVRGEGVVRNGWLSEQAPHLELAKMAGDYLVASQNKETGGWPVNVTRKFDTKSGLYLKPGWQSAMAQGHAISLLCRLHKQAESKNEGKYLEAALRAFKLFEMDLDKGKGFRAYFMNSTKLVWFEGLYLYFLC